MPAKDPYELLGVTRSASGEEIRKAYRRLVREHHPDMNPDDPSAEERFKKVQHAYEVLSNPQKRQKYDQRSRANSGRGSSHAHPGRGSGRPRADAGSGHEGNAFSVELSDLLAKLGYLSSGHPGGQKEVSREVQGEDIARVAKLLGVNVSRISELLGEHVKAKVNVSFGNDVPGRASAVETLSEEEPTKGDDRKPPKSRKSPRPPKSGKDRKP